MHSHNGNLIRHSRGLSKVFRSDIFACSPAPAKLYALIEISETLVCGGSDEMVKLVFRNVVLTMIGLAEKGKVYVIS